MDKLAIFCFVWISKNNDVNRLVFGHLYENIRIAVACPFFVNPFLASTGCVATALQ